MPKKKLQVFVSSTFSDLIPERQAAVSAILKAGHIPAGMELFTSGDKSQMETIEKWIDESDVYMLILGGRYGSIEPTSGVSYTEREYDYAVRQGKPFFAVVINEAELERRVMAVGKEVIELKNPSDLIRFREKVLSNISSFFTDEKDIKLCVHESLSEFAANRDLTGWISGAEVESIEQIQSELKRLRDENDALKANTKAVKFENASASDATKGGAMSDAEFRSLTEILSSIEINVPEKLANIDKSTMTLYEAFTLNGHRFVNGVTNGLNTDDGTAFLYFNVSPKLELHGLVRNEAVPGVRWRRSALTKLGRQYLAELDRRYVEIKKKKEREAATASAGRKESPADA